MSYMPLTEKQKTMLTALIPYFDSGTLTNTWGALRGNDRIFLRSIGGIPLAQITEWEHIQESDLSVFVELVQTHKTGRDKEAMNWASKA